MAVEAYLWETSKIVELTPMESLFDLEFYYQAFETSKNWALSNLFVWENVVQFAAQIAILLLVRLLGSIFGRMAQRRFGDRIKKE